MTRDIFLAALASAMLTQLAKAQNITTTGYETYPTLPRSFAEYCPYESLYYRTIDGSCNNLEYYDWGKAKTYFYRGPEGSQYAPGTSMNHWQTIDSRVVSNMVGSDGQAPNFMGSQYGEQDLSHTPNNLFAVYFAQWVNHDLEYNEAGDLHPIADVTYDWLYHCKPNSTNNYNPSNSCYQMAGKSSGGIINGKFEVQNEGNSWLDMSNVYSPEPESAKALRSFINGKLSVRDWHTDGGQYASYSTVVKNTLMSGEDTDDKVEFDLPSAPKLDPKYVMISGDPRAPQVAQLILMHTLFTREHNYQAERYYKMYPHATDEQLYQLARRYTIACYQKIVYEEYLPTILGYSLPPYSGYKSSVYAGTSIVFATGAFRYGHTLARDFDMYDGCSPSGSSLLKVYDDAFVHGGPYNDYRLFFQGQIFGLGDRDMDLDPARVMALAGGRHGDGFDNIIISLIKQKSAKYDTVMSNTLRNIPGIVDLLSLDIYRGRANGLPNYDTIRKYYHPEGSIYNNPACDPRAYVDSDYCWGVLTSNHTLAAKLKDMYKKVNNVDAFIGMLAEEVPYGAYLPPTVVGVITSEFIRKRDGDRFYYENNYYYTEDEISSIKSTTFANIIERNTGVKGMPSNVFYVNGGAYPYSTNCY